VPRGVGIDSPGLGTRIQNVSDRMGTRPLNRKAGVVQVVDEQVEVHALLSVLTWPRRWSIAGHSMEGKAADGLPAESQPVGVAFRVGQVEDLLPEPGQSLRVVAFENELGQPAYGHSSNLCMSAHIRVSRTAADAGVDVSARMYSVVS
jgi:hypothetical protein